jgi:hypothetical protein
MGSQQYYRPEDAEAKFVGAGILFVGITALNLRNTGPFWDLKKKEDIKPVDLESDNCVFSEDVVDEQTGELSFSILAGHLQDIFLMRGGLDLLTVTLAETATIVTDEHVKLTGTGWTRLANRMGDRTLVTISSVEENKETSPTTYVLDTDYEKQVDTAGYTRIRRKGTTITEGATVLVSYTYKPAVEVKLSTGGVETISPLFYRFLHVARLDGDKIYGYMWDIYRGVLKNGGDENVPKDKDKKEPYKQPFVITCKLDDSRQKGDQLWNKRVIKGRTLAELGMDYLDKNELGVSIRAMMAGA